jgi:hypothetical protein
MRMRRALLLAVLSAIVFTGCGETSVSSIRTDYACSYPLQVQEATNTAEIAKATRPSDLAQAMEGGSSPRVIQAWQQAVEERNSLTGTVKQGTTLLIPARCGSSPPSSQG